MSQTYALDRVVRRVSADVSAGPSQRVITIDVPTRRAISRPTISFRRQLGYVLVSNRSDPQNEARVSIPGTVVADTDHSVAVSITLFVSCDAENETRVAEALFDDAASPEEVLGRHVKRWVIEAARDNVPAFVTDSVENRGDVQRRLAADLGARTGLRVQAKLSFDAEHSLNPIRIDVPALQVYLKDLDEEQELRFRVDLDVDIPQKAAAIIHFPKNLTLHQSVPKEIKSFLREHVTFQQYCTEMTTGAPRTQLVDHLNQVLRAAGRRLGAVVLEPSIPAGLEFEKPLQLTVSANVQEFPEPVAIRIQALMRLTDAAKYRAAGAPRVDRWFLGELDRLIPRVLFDAKYIDLLIGFEAKEREIRTEVERHAAAIGYDIRQLITVPDLEPLRYPDGIRIDTTDQFETRLPNVPVRLQFVAMARIEKLESIKEYLNRHQHVPTLMKEAIVDVVRERLHGIDPERAYMRFSFADGQREGEEKSVEAELVDAITERLRTRFSASIISIVIKPVDTELVERFRVLQARASSFAVPVVPLAGGPQVTIHGTLAVTAVHPLGWHRFVRAAVSLDQIRERVEDHLLGRLHTFTSGELTYRKREHRKELEDFVTATATAFVADQFGLCIEITSVRRDQTTTETDLTNYEDERQAAVIAHARADLERRRVARVTADEHAAEQLNVLLELRTKLIGMPGTADEITDLDRKIDALTSPPADADTLPTMKELRADRSTLSRGTSSYLMPNQAIASPSDPGAAQENA